MITLGFDTEFAIVKSRNIATSMVGKVGGTKKDPMLLSAFFEKHKKSAPTFLKDTLDKYYIQEDNVFIELNTPPVDNHIDFQKIVSNQILIANEVKSIVCPSGFPSFGNGFLLTKFDLESDQAQTFGCDPDFNAWSGEMNHSPARETQVRTTGAHLHVGYADHNINKTREIVKCLDLTLGMGSIIENMQGFRMNLYGRPGAFRPKPYGLEYRFMPSIWLQLMNTKVFNGFINTDNTMSSTISTYSPSVLYYLVLGIVSLINEGKTAEDIFDSQQIDIMRYFILSYDVKACKAMKNTSLYKKSLLKIFEASGIFKMITKAPTETTAKHLYEHSYGGIIT